MHLAIKLSPRVTNDRKATAWLEEVTSELAKTINLSSDICPIELNITDASNTTQNTPILHQPLVFTVELGPSV